MPALEIAETQEAWSRVEQSTEWAGLTEAQRIFVVMFLATGGSALAAVRAGYRPTTEHNAQTMSYELSRNRRIVAVLDVAAAKVHSDREELVALVRKQLKAAEPGSIAAQRLCAQLGSLLNLRVPEADAVADEPTAAAESAVPALKFEVGEIVRQNGVRFKVTSVDDAGNILSAVEVEDRGI